MRAYRGVVGYELGPGDLAHRQRFVRLDHDDDGSLLIRARLPAEEGALVAAALEAGRDAIRQARAPRRREGDERTAGAGGMDVAGGEEKATTPGEARYPDGAAPPAASGASAETTQTGDGPVAAATDAGAAGARAPAAESPSAETT